MASVMRASTSAYKSGMLGWSYGGLNLVVFVRLTNTPPGGGVWGHGYASYNVPHRTVHRYTVPVPWSR